MLNVKILIPLAFWPAMGYTEVSVKGKDGVRMIICSRRS